MTRGAHPIVSSKRLRRQRMLLQGSSRATKNNCCKFLKGGITLVAEKQLLAAMAFKTYQSGPDSSSIDGT